MGSASLFIEQHPDNAVAFYINGDLQFDSRDEAIYHQYLVGPAMALARTQFPTEPIRVLICGGGDGLAARDILKFPNVEVVLVDYDAAVLELAKTQFADYNKGSLDSVSVQVGEAFEYVRSQQIPFHAIICDFTLPTCPEMETVYSQEWFQELHRLLVPGGVMATNGMSPDRNTTAFWCLYQTILSAGFNTKPMGLHIPSFAELGYGQWGFFLAIKNNPAPSIDFFGASHLESLTFPNGFQHLKNWLKCFEFPQALAIDRHLAYLHTLDQPYLLYALFNGISKPIEQGDCLNFLGIQDQCTGVIRDRNPFHSTAQTWLQQAKKSMPNPGALCPIQHPGMTPEMAQSWLHHSEQMLNQVDLTKLRDRLPTKLAEIFQEKSEEFAIALTAVMMAANLAVPDTAYAKGSSSVHSSGGSSSSSTSCYEDDNGTQVCDANPVGIWGLTTLVVGGAWLTVLVAIKIFKGDRE
jgi:spermidine synthase